MKYILREIYYYFIKIFIKLKYKHIKICFRAKIGKKSVFEGHNKIEHHSYFNGYLGMGSYIGEYSNVSGKVGRYCSIGGHVNVISLTHPVRNFVSTSPCFYSTKKQNGMSYVNKQKFNEELHVENSDYPVIIGNDVYIGFGATIIAPVVIGDGAVIAAGSIVTKNVEPYTIVGGNPAREIGKRFSEEKIEKLLHVQWWNKNKKWISKNIDLFDDISRFLSSDLM